MTVNKSALPFIGLFEKMGDELAETSAPGKPFVVGACRFVIVGVDTHVVEALDEFLGAEHLVHAFRATHHEEIVNLLVELVGIGEHAIVGSLRVETEDGATESAHIREEVHVLQYKVEGLVSAP